MFDLDHQGTQMRESCATQGGSPRPRPANDQLPPLGVAS